MLDETLVVIEEPVKKKEDKIKVDRFTGLRVSHGYSWVGFRGKNKTLKKVPYPLGQSLVDHKYFTKEEFDSLENY